MKQSITYIQESQIVRPANGTQPNDWPCFLLTEAAVYNKDGQMANLLEVDLEGPFMIRGIMVVEPDQSSSCKSKEPSVVSTSLILCAK